jgi:hypothetical protein
MEIFCLEPTAFSQDPRLLIRDPRLFSRDPRLFSRDPRLFIRDPRLFIRDPRLFTHDPRLFTHDVLPTTHDFLPTTHDFLPTTHDFLPTTHDPRLLASPCRCRTRPVDRAVDNFIVWYPTSSIDGFGYEIGIRPNIFKYFKIWQSQHISYYPLCDQMAVQNYVCYQC